MFFETIVIYYRLLAENQIKYYCNERYLYLVVRTLKVRVAQGLFFLLDKFCNKFENSYGGVDDSKTYRDT